MTDHNVFVFGSFTEDEIKSLQSSSKENDVQFMFGSLDSATLRSVGIFNNIPNDIKIPKNHLPSDLVKQTNNNEIVHTTTKESQNSISVVHKNGDYHESSSVSSNNGKKEQEQKDAELPVSFVPENACDTQAVTLSPSSSEEQEKVDTVRSFEILDLNDIKNDTLTAVNDLHTTVTELLPRGLVNSGNLCFLNATLQALLACSPFVHLLQELRTRNIPEIGYPTLRAFVDFISGFDLPHGSHSKRKDDFLETGRPFRPVMFESVLNNFSPDMPNSFSGRPRQEDAQEFLSFVMHQLHDELLKFEGVVSVNNGEKVSLVSSVSDEDDESWETVGPKNKTAITRTQSFIPSKLSEIFGGQLKSVVKARGNKASATIQPFLLLHLNICPEPVRTVEDALHLFSAPETLEGYRASSAGKGELGRKYELVATISHHGREPSKGHYTADIMHPTGKWLRFDDASVVPISTKKVLHDQAYVLFYKQQ